MMSLTSSRRSLVLASVVAAVPGRAPVSARSWQAALLESKAETVFDTVFAATELPAGDVEAVFYRLTVPPGERLTHLVGPLCGCGGEHLAPGVGVELVQAGSYAVGLDAPFRVRRADGSDEDVPAGADARLGPGDAAVYPAYASPGDIRGEGGKPAVVVGLAIVSAAATGTPAPDVPTAVRGERLASITPMTWSAAFGEGGIAVRFDRLELAAGGKVGPYAPAGVEAMLIESGDIEVGTLPPGETGSPHRPFAYGAGRAVPFLVLAAGSQRVLLNPGKEPAVLLVASLASASGDASSGSAG